MPNTHAPTPPAAGGARVLRFPVRESTTALVVDPHPPMEPVRVYFCQCGAFVSSPGARCLACCVEDRGE